jgi:hypothetical protein
MLQKTPRESMSATSRTMSNTSRPYETFNMHEAGCEESADRKPRSVILPHQQRRRRIQYSAVTSGHCGRCAVATFSHSSKDGRRGSLGGNWRNVQDFRLQSTQTSSVTRDLCDGFLEHLASMREGVNLYDSPVVLFCDNCNARIDE